MMNKNNKHHTLTEKSSSLGGLGVSPWVDVWLGAGHPVSHDVTHVISSGRGVAAWLAKDPSASPHFRTLW